MNISAWFFHFDYLEYSLCTMMSALVLTAEVINTALESLVDLTTTEIHPLAKIAKDCGAAAVLIVAVLSVLIWGIIVMHHFDLV